MRLLILLVIVGVCLVSAKYLPDESNNFKELLSRHKRSDSDDDSNDSSSNNTDDISDEELMEQSKLHARIEKMRQKLLEKQEKERRKQEEAQQKLEERIARELQKEEEKRQKEEEQRQKILQKEEERRQKELQKAEERRQKEEEKRQKELRKHEEKLEKERIKLEEQQQKLREKAFENEQKRQEMLQKQLEEMEEETLKLQVGDNNSSDSDTDESSELEDFWKSYIYTKYGLNESNTELEKRIALRRYMQEELGLNVNSTESERRKAILGLIESKLQAVSEQYVLQTQMIDFVNRVGVEKIRAQLEKEIEEINNKTDILNNVALPWVPIARENFAEQVSFLQTIKEFLASILPNWYNENITSTESTLNDASSQNEKVSSAPSENQSFSESSLISSDTSSNSDSTPPLNNPNDFISSNIPILPGNSGLNAAIDSLSTILEKNSSPAFGSSNSNNEGSGNDGKTNGAYDASSSTGQDVNTNKPAVSGADLNNSVLKTMTTSAPVKASDNKSDNTSTIDNSNDMNTSAISILLDNSGLNVAVDTLSTILNENPSPAYESGNSDNEGSGSKGADDTSSTIGTDVFTSKPVATEVVLNSSVSKTVATAAPVNAPDFIVAVINSKNEADSNGITADDGMNLVVRTNSDGIIPLNSDPTSTNLVSNNDALSSVISGDAPTPSAGAASVLNNSEIISTIVPGSVSDSTSDFAENSSNSGKGDAILPNLKNTSLTTNVNNNSSLTDSLDDSLNGSANKIISTSIDQDPTVTKDASGNLSTVVTKIMPSSITTEASDVIMPVASNSENKLSSDTPQSSGNNVPVANNIQMDVANAPQPNDSLNSGDILPSTTESTGLGNIITSIGGGITNHVDDEILTALNIASSTDESIYTSLTSTNDNNPLITLSPTLLTERQDIASSLTDNSNSSDIIADLKTTVVTESPNNINTPNTGSIQPIIDVAVDDKNENNISGISVNPTDDVSESTTDNIISLNVTPNVASPNNERTIGTHETTSEPSKPAGDISIDNQNLEGLNVASKVDNQNISKTLNVPENQNLNEPQTTISSIHLDDVTLTPSGATSETDALLKFTLNPSGIVTENIDVASKGVNVSNTDTIISKNSSTSTNDAVSDSVTTELPDPVTDLLTTDFDESTSVVSDAQQVGNDNVTEDQYVTLSDTGISIVTKSGNNPSVTDQETPIDDITVPVEHGASVVAVVPQ